MSLIKGLFSDIGRLAIVLPLSIVVLILFFPTVILHLIGKFLSVVVTYPLRRGLGVLMPMWFRWTGMESFDIVSLAGGGVEDEPQD